jgi:plastocyanin
MRFAAVFTAVVCLLAAATEAKSGRGTITGKVTVRHKGAAVKNARVVVYLEEIGKAKKLGRSVRNKSPRISQRGRKFKPEFTVVVRGQKVKFPNDDNTTHNVYSNSDGNRFDFGEYREGTTRSTRFRKAGTVDVECNIHPKMSATILVVDNDYWRETNADGSFAIENVPAGTYELVAWVPYSPRERIKVEVKAGEATALKPIVLEEGELPPKVRKDGRPHDFWRAGR